ncbi:divalent-cation tolerance protein CutA (plasmid) [Streptomyces sp. BI20]|uniref:divalent-cation tolerance protein CutA n=1 Tax=Streptomyces sp. BI20 TaxID=3403460 RepID=UPI003C72C8CD
MTGIVIAQTTIDDEVKAKALARGAVEARLAACAHIDAPFDAVYWWDQKVQFAREWRVSFKVPADRADRLWAWVAAEHPYEVPEWILLPLAGGAEAYLRWVAAETAPQ